MNHSVKYSAQAVRDLDRTWDEVFEASKSLEITAKYINDLLDKIESKRMFPLSGIPLYYDDLFTGYYYVIFKSYLAFYSVEGNTMLVSRILYAKSDYILKLNLKLEDDNQI